MAEQLTTGGITVTLSRPEKVLFPDDGVTKGDLIAYYERVAGPMLAFLADRPIMMARYPDGITGHRLVQKNVPGYFPDWISRVTVPKQDGVVEQVICDKPATLVYLANQAVIEVHAFLSRADKAGKLDFPDQLIIDLDPEDDEHFPDVRRAAQWTRELLDGDLGLRSWVRTTGGRGLHVVVPLDRRADFDTVRDFAHKTARVLAARHPDVLTAEQRKDKRGDRLYLDMGRNAYAQTAVASYSVRARPGATVATPLHWDEVADDGLTPHRFTISSVPDRLDSVPDPWDGFPGRGQSLAEASDRLAALDA
jgi:bifunctional non-homologous end joining protein LigD